MKPGATTLFVFDDDAARAAVREARDACDGLKYRADFVTAC